MGDFGKDKELVSQLKVIMSFSFLQSMWLEFSTSLISLWSVVRIVRRDQVNRTCKNFVYSITQNNKIVRLSNMADTFFEKSMRCTKVVFCFSCLCFLDAEWLSRQSPITWMGVVHTCMYQTCTSYCMFCFQHCDVWISFALTTEHRQGEFSKYL